MNLRYIRNKCYEPTQLTQMACLCIIMNHDTGHMRVGFVKVLICQGVKSVTQVVAEYPYTVLN